MIKKIFIYLVLILFSTNVVAQDLIMKCGEYTYKYISDPNGDKVLSENYLQHADHFMRMIEDKNRNRNLAKDNTVNKPAEENKTVSDTKNINDKDEIKNKD